METIVPMASATRTGTGTIVDETDVYTNAETHGGAGHMQTNTEVVGPGDAHMRRHR